MKNNSRKNNENNLLIMPTILNTKKMNALLHSLEKKLALLIFFSFISAITFAQWSAPVDISPNAVSALLNESMGSCIGTAGDSVNVVWADRINATRGILYYRHSLDAGTTWNNPIVIADTLAGNAWHPAIAVNGLNIHVAWMEIDPANNAHRTNYYIRSLDGGNTWLPKVVLDTAVGDWPAITVSGNRVSIANDWHLTAQNSEIFLRRSLDNGTTWGANQQLTFCNGRSEDEAIQAQGSHIHMTWNDNRNGNLELFYKESNDYGVTWGPDVQLAPSTVYGPAICVDTTAVDLVCSQTPNLIHAQIYFRQSLDSGATWGPIINLTHDTLSAFIYPTIIRCGSDIHVTYIKVGSGVQYLHSGNNGLTWDNPVTIFSGSAGITAFAAYSGCTLHIIYINNTTKHIYYLNNPTGNAGHCIATAIAENSSQSVISLFPNPTNNSVTIQSSTELGRITIYNSLGEIIYNESTNATSQQIDLSDFSNGIYFVSTQGKFLKLLKQ